MKPDFKFATFLAVIGCSVLSASATTFYWDGTANVNLGQSDNTNTTSQAWLSGGLWDDGSTSAALGSWIAGDSAIFGGSAASQTVTLGSTITVGNLTFGGGANGSGTSGTAYTISGGTLTFSNTALTANTATVITSSISNAGTANISGPGALTLRGGISGSGTLTHSGSGLLTLSAADGGRDYFGALAGAGSVSVGTSAGNFYGLHGSLSGLSGTITMSGLVHNRASALGSTTAAFVQSGGTWLVSNDDIANLNVTYNMGSLSGSGTIAGAGYSAARSGTKTISVGALNTDTTYSGVIQNAFSGGATSTIALTKIGGGTLTLTGSNSYTSGTTINGGTLQIGSGSGTSGVLPGNATINANGTLKFNYGSPGVVYGGQLSGTGAVIVTGANNDLQLSGNNSGFAGAITVDGGGAHLRMRNDNAISGAALVLANGGSVSVFSYVSDHNLTVGSLASGDSSTWVRVGSNNNRGLIVGGNNQSTTFAGVIKNDAGGTGFLTKTGSGTLTLSGSNTYTGTTTLNAGTINLGAAESAGTSGPLGQSAAANPGSIVLNGGALQYSSSNQNDYSGRFSTASGQQYNVDTNGQSVTWATALTSSGGSLTKTGSGTLSLSAQNTYNGTTTINGGVLNLTMGISFTPSKVGSNVVINSGGSLVLNAYFQTGFAYNLAGNVAPANITVNAGGTFNKNGQATYIENLTLNGNGVVIGSGGSGNDNLQLCGDVTATSTAAGAPSISNLNLVAGAYTDAGNTRTFTVTHGAGSTSAVDLTIGAIGQQTSGPVASLIKTGGGTMEITGTGAYAGTTVVSQGKLVINGSISTSTLTTVQTGATIGGSGTVGALTVNDGAFLAPGNSIESLGVGALSLEGGSTYAYELQTNLYAGTPGVAGDLTYSSGNLGIASGAILTLTDLAASTTLANGSTLTLISYLGAWNGGLFSYDAGAGLTTLADDSIFTLGANQWLFNYNDTIEGANYTGDSAGNFVTMTVVPEPSAAALFGGLGMLALLRRRRVE